MIISIDELITNPKERFKARHSSESTVTLSTGKKINFNKGSHHNRTIDYDGSLSAEETRQLVLATKLMGF